MYEVSFFEWIKTTVASWSLFLSARFFVLVILRRLKSNWLNMPECVTFAGSFWLQRKPSGALCTMVTPPPFSLRNWHRRRQVSRLRDPISYNTSGSTLWSTVPNETHSNFRKSLTLVKVTFMLVGWYFLHNFSGVNGFCRNSLPGTTRTWCLRCRSLRQMEYSVYLRRGTKCRKRDIGLKKSI